MKLSKQRKVYAAILALAATALGFDRLFLAGGETTPSRANAQTLAQPSARYLPPPAGSTGAATVSAAEPLAQRLRKLYQKQGIDMAAVRDAFSCSQDWLPKQDSARQSSSSEVESAQFQSQHTLMAVMAGVHGSAIVNGKCLLVGQKLDGYELVSVTQRCAVFQSGDRQITLTLKD